MKFIIILLVSSSFFMGSILVGQCISDCSGDETRFGEAAGLNNTGDEVSIFGRSAGLNNTGDYNSFFGFNAGRNTTGNNNSFFGHFAGNNDTTGDNNSFFGAESGRVVTTGGANSFFGGGSGISTSTGSFNSFYGDFSGRDNKTGDYNSFFGFHSGLFNSTGSHNIAIGSSAGPMLTNGDIDSTLYIDVHVTDDPLIYGQFNEHLVRINGEFEAMGGVANSSDMHRKRNIHAVDEDLILEKVAQLELSEWSYKDESEVRHLGPMAQDFYKAFGLGKNETTITTLDADGVALAAIQALYQLWQEEKERNDQLEKKVDRILVGLSKNHE